MKREFKKAFNEVKKLACFRPFSVSIEHDSWNEGLIYHVYIAAPHDNEDAYVHMYSPVSFDHAIDGAKEKLIKLGLMLP